MKSAGVFIRHPPPPPRILFRRDSSYERSQPALAGTAVNGTSFVRIYETKACGHGVSGKGAMLSQKFLGGGNLDFLPWSMACTSTLFPPCFAAAVEMVVTVLLSAALSTKRHGLAAPCLLGTIEKSVQRKGGVTHDTILALCDRGTPPPHMLSIGRSAVHIVIATQRGFDAAYLVLLDLLLERVVRVLSPSPPKISSIDAMAFPRGTRCGAVGPCRGSARHGVA